MAAAEGHMVARPSVSGSGRNQALCRAVRVRSACGGKLSALLASISTRVGAGSVSTESVFHRDIIF